jgi:hypothetical protein
MAEISFLDADERAHAPSGDVAWEEAWHFDFAAGDGALGGYARLTLRPGEGRAWWWTAVVGEDVAFVLVREHEVAPPRLPSLEIRAAGLWAEPYCEAPFDHWSVGLEAMAVALDDPVEAYGRERGHPVPLGLDLGWEATGRPAPHPGGYGQPCEVHGEVLVGARRLAVAGTGARSHTWGLRDWASPAPDAGGVELDDRGLVAAARVGGRRLEPVFHAPIQVPVAGAPAGRPAHLARALCRAAAGPGAGPHDAPPGWVWVERLQPASSTMG